MADVLDRVRAPQAWARGRGDGVSIAIVDTGISGARPEFPAWKRDGGWAEIGSDPWTDWQGHGSMCASIAAGTSADGGAVDGIAPDAKLISCRTRFYDSELTLVYDELADRFRNGEKIVISNSFGIKTGSPPSIGADDEFPDALSDALELGVPVYFSAGNYHEIAGGAAAACDPTSIWLYKCLDSLVTVGTCDLEERMWYYSSRGPGQWHGQDGSKNQKPDVIAPTPRNGEIVHGDALRVLPNGWGTSGACPQVAGLAALLLSIDGSLTSADIANVIRSSARDIGLGRNCQGEGVIDCDAAVSQV